MYKARWTKRKNLELKLVVLNHYGGKCACCGIDDFRFLTVDHKNNDGRHDPRKKGHAGMEWYKTIIRAGFPKDLQVLCWNCNMGKEKFGSGEKCPHKTSIKTYLARFYKDFGTTRKYKTPRSFGTNIKQAVEIVKDWVKNP